MNPTQCDQKLFEIAFVHFNNFKRYFLKFFIYSSIKENDQFKLPNNTIYLHYDFRKIVTPLCAAVYAHTNN